jgi:hypothetical protein
LAIDKAKSAPKLLELKWASFLNAAPAAEGTAAKKSAGKKSAAKGKTKEVVAVE